MSTTKTKKEYIPKGEVYSFYGGKVKIEKKPWGEHFRFINIETGEGGILSATACTGKLDKSDQLVPWAIGLVSKHINSYVENSNSNSFTKEEIFLIVQEAIKKPEEGKVKGGEAGTIIHDYAHDFAKAVLSKSPLPTFDHLNRENEIENKALNGINAFLTWYTENKVEFIKMEDVVYYNSFLAGESKNKEKIIEGSGIRDLLARVNGKLLTVDYKTSKGIYSSQRYQVSFYDKAHNSNVPKEEQTEGTLILNFSKDTGELIEKFIPKEEAEKDFKAYVGLNMVATREKELTEEYYQSKKK